MPERFLPCLFVLLWSSSFVAVKTGLRDMTPLLFVALRLTIAAAVLLLVLWFLAFLLPAVALVGVRGEGGARVCHGVSAGAALVGHPAGVAGRPAGRHRGGFLGAILVDRVGEARHGSRAGHLTRNSCIVERALYRPLLTSSSINFNRRSLSVSVKYRVRYFVAVVAGVGRYRWCRSSDFCVCTVHVYTENTAISIAAFAPGSD